jgi:hypothetical protein
MSQLFDKIYNFLVTSPLQYITAFSIIYQAIEDDTWIEKENLRTIISTAINTAIADHYFQNKNVRDKFHKILTKVN